MQRTEVLCSNAAASLGHVLDDGPKSHRPALLHQFRLANFEPKKDANREAGKRGKEIIRGCQLGIGRYSLFGKLVFPSCKRKRFLHLLAPHPQSS
jgi:hypothetical protein